MELSPIQLQALDKGEAVPLTVDGRDCVLLTSTSFHETRRMLEEWHPLAMQRQMAEVMRDDWNDPAMSVYDK